MNRLPNWARITIAVVLVAFGIAGCALSTSQPVLGIVLSVIGFGGILVILILNSKARKDAADVNREDDTNEEDDDFDEDSFEEGDDDDFDTEEEDDDGRK